MSNGNEPAFPEVKPEGDQTYDNGTLDAFVVSRVWSEGGMSKRELIAAMAMQGLSINTTSSHTASMIARAAVRHADALLAELAKEAT